MQLITYYKKYLFLAVLSCSLIIVLMSDNPVVTEFNSTEIAWNNTTETLESESSNTQPSTVKPAESVWSNMGRELMLDHQAQSTQVQAEIRKLLADREKLKQILKAAAPYIYFIRQQTEVRGLPAELALIPIIESEFNPNDRSKKGATGLWQLMPVTAQELGVKVKSGYDGRRNVVASTKAALAYFNDLGKLFKGNWYLAIAAYNCGQQRIKSAVRRAGTQSFWQLRLPKETKLYVPKLLAVAAIVKNPEKYGIQLPPVTDKPYFAEVSSTKKMNLAKVSKSTGVSIRDLNTLNPDMSKSKVESYSVLVPINKAPAAKAQLGAK